MTSETDSPDSTNSLQSPHNRFVLGFYGSPDKAKGLLEAQLPNSFREVLCLDELEVDNSHFVDEQMSEVESDLLFRIPRNDREEAAYVYVLWEHQRKRDSLMALRMWVYMGMIYRQLVADDKLLPGKKLPFVYPIVLFQGTEGWKKGLSLAELIDFDGLDQELYRWVPQFEIDLIRLDEPSPRIQPQQTITRLGLSLMQAVMVQDVKNWLENHINELDSAFNNQREPVILILTYALMSGGGLTDQEFLDIIHEKGTENMKYEAGSVAEQLINRGRTEGREEGREEEREEIVVRLISKGMDDAEIADITHMSSDAIAEIRKKVDSAE